MVCAILVLGSGPAWAQVGQLRSQFSKGGLSGAEVPADDDVLPGDWGKPSPTNGAGANAGSGASGDAGDPSGLGFDGFNSGGIDFGGLELGSKAPPDSPGRWTAEYFLGSEYRGENGSGRTAMLRVTAVLSPKWHIYALDQKVGGGGLPTKLAIDSPESVELAGRWASSQPAVTVTKAGTRTRQHRGAVSFMAPIRLPTNFRGPIQVSIDALACREGTCLPWTETLVANFGDGSAGDAAAAAQVVARSDTADLSGAQWFRDGDYVVQWAGVPASRPTSGDAAVSFTARPEDEFHVYVSATEEKDSSTVFVVTEKAGLKVGPPQTTAEVKTITHEIASIPSVSYHLGQVTWQLPLAVPPNAKPGGGRLAGYVLYQACTDNSCHQPKAVAWEVAVKVDAAKKKVSFAGPVKFSPVAYAKAADAAAEVRWVDELADQDGLRGTADGGGDSSGSSLGVILGLSFLAGLILNVMPCVLPVVGLKVMGFVAQAGEDKGRILMLNLVYAAGILSVFAILGALSSVASLGLLGLSEEGGSDSFGWGEQFTFFEVRYGLTILLFALALSYLGVWEIPAPGAASGKGSQQLQSREGLLGAFGKGALATVLSTPCSGPLLGAILGLTLTLSAAQTFVIILTVGVGMAAPYVVLGFNPSLIGFLPKPGAWMERFKEFLAFLLLGTVAFFFIGFGPDQSGAVFISLIAVWFGCWIIGQVPSWEKIEKRMTSWVIGVSTAALVSWAAFYFTRPGDDLDWVPYSEARLAELNREGKTVILDFTASWCVNCKVNTALSIDTSKTAAAVKRLGAVAMLADWSDRNARVKRKIVELESKSIPLLAIYPGRRPEEPIVLRDLVSQASVLEALEQAGPSVGVEPDREQAPDASIKTKLSRRDVGGVSSDAVAVAP